MAHLPIHPKVKAATLAASVSVVPTSLVLWLLTYLGVTIPADWVMYIASALSGVATFIAGYFTKAK